MKNIYIINGGQKFEGFGGELNATLTEWSVDFFKEMDAEVKVTNINEPYIATEEAAKYVWADLVIYHFPVWWFQVPFKLKEFFDVVLEAGHGNGIYANDGRSRKTENPKLGYGTGGLLQGRKYMITTTWNAPIEAFTVSGEFLDGHTEDDVFFGVHKMNQFVGMTRLSSYHLHEVEKDDDELRMSNEYQAYFDHLTKITTEV